MKYIMRKSALSLMSILLLYGPSTALGGLTLEFHSPPVVKVEPAVPISQSYALPAVGSPVSLSVKIVNDSDQSYDALSLFGGSLYATGDSLFIDWIPPYWFASPTPPAPFYYDENGYLALDIPAYDFVSFPILNIWGIERDFVLMTFQSAEIGQQMTIRNLELDFSYLDENPQIGHSEISLRTANTVTVTVIPEPATLSFLWAGLFWVRRSRIWAA